MAAAHAGWQALPESDRYLPVWLDAGDAAGTAPALLSVPPGWHAGDAAVVMAPGGDWPPAMREDVVAALLDAGVAVLRVVAPRAEPGLPASAERDVAAALRLMDEAFAAGAVLAIGKGEGGVAALAAAAQAVNAQGRRFAAAARLGPGSPDFLAPEPLPGLARPAGAPRLCEVLSALRPAQEPETMAACLQRLADNR
jgi:hypothetical protein